MAFKTRAISLISFFFCIMSVSVSFAADKTYVSIKTGEAYLRAGPSKNYPIKWVYKNKGEPLEVVADFENWKKVQDFSGDSGWIHSSVVSKSRSGVVKAQAPVVLHKSASNDARKILKLEPGVRFRIIKCQSNWCQIKVGKLSGWVRSSQIWGDTSS